MPVPSIFFIGKSGTPLEIGTGIIASVEELEAKIDKVLTASGKTTPAVSASSSFIAAEQETATAGTSKTPADKKKSVVVCEGDVCYKTTESEPTVKTNSEAAADATAGSEAADTNARLEETRKLLEQRRRERVEEEKRQEKEDELRRRQDGKNMQNLQSWQKEHELKELKVGSK